MDNTEQSYWDPRGKEVNKLTYVDQKEAFIKKIQKYRNHPYIFKFYLALSCLPTIIGVFLLTSYFKYDIVFVMISCVLPIAYYAYVKDMQNDLLLFLLCEKNNWIYNPKKDTDAITGLTVLFPRVSEYANYHYLDEQVWGRIQIKNLTIPFWKGLFHYRISGGRSQEAVVDNVFFLKLEHSYPVNFTLQSPGLFGEHREIKTESEVFNKTFGVVSDSKDTDSKLQIMKVLSPSVQTRLVDLYSKYHIRAIAFKTDIITIAVYDDKMWKARYTNFFRKVAIDERDEKEFYTALTEITELFVEMGQFI
jgi:hypothetical protein